MVRTFVVLGWGLLLGGCAGKSASGGGDSSGGFIEAGGKSGDAGAPNGGSSGAAGSAGVVSSGASCSPDGAQATNGCADCVCTQGSWVCGHKTCTATPCGGFLGSTCNPDEYCAYEVGQSCGAADASATCQPRPTACDDVYSPVCGCDMMTYGNECDAASQGTGVLQVGACPK